MFDFSAIFNKIILKATRRRAKQHFQDLDPKVTRLFYWNISLSISLKTLVTYDSEVIFKLSFKSKTIRKQALCSGMDSLKQEHTLTAFDWTPSLFTIRHFLDLGTRWIVSITPCVPTNWIEVNVRFIVVPSLILMTFHKLRR